MQRYLINTNLYPDLYPSQEEEEYPPDVSYSSAEDDPATSRGSQTVHQLLSLGPRASTEDLNASAAAACGSLVRRRVASKEHLVASALHELGKQRLQRQPYYGVDSDDEALRHTYNDYTLADIRKHADSPVQVPSTNTPLPSSANTPLPPVADNIPKPPAYRPPTPQKSSNNVQWPDDRSRKRQEFVEGLKADDERRLLEADKRRAERFFPAPF